MILLLRIGIDFQKKAFTKIKDMIRIRKGIERRTEANVSPRTAFLRLSDFSINFCSLSSNQDENFSRSVIFSIEVASF